MRQSSVAAVTCLCLCLLPLAGAFPGDLQVPPGSPPAASSQAAAAAGDPAAGDPAAKHAKRTACLKDAKGKKLVGADKTAFIKRCIATP
jgi:hypothetical protein